MTKEFPLVFARSIDMADYFRRHVKTTPRTVFVSRTDHIFYDMHWHNLWAGRHELVTRERLPWLTRISTIHKLRRTDHGAKDPMSYEYIIFEDQKRSIRFERESPNPIWWFEYTDHGPEAMRKGGVIPWRETPDVDVVQITESDASGVGRPPQLPKWESTEHGMSIRLKMLTKSTFEDYHLALWGVPESFVSRPDERRISSNAKEVVSVKSRDGEVHFIVRFDLKPDAILQLEIRDK